MRKFSFIIISLLSLLTACGGGLSIEVEIPLLCTTRKGVEFPGVALGMALDKSFDIPINDQIPLNGVDKAETVLRLERLTVAATSGNPSFAQIEKAIISVASSARDPIDVLKYQSDPEHPATTELTATGDPVDIAAYINASQLTIRLVATGIPPSSPWTGDVTICLSGSNKIPYP